MSPPGTSTLAKAVGQRLAGDKPGPMQAFVAAAVTGTAVAVLTYKALRK
jgi:hypothetical protein